jgi:hypothetical protein
MEIFRPLIGFVLGLTVAIGAYVGGFLEGIPHWSRTNSHWAGGPASIDPDQPRYRVGAEFEPDDGASDDDICPPRFDFRNRTSRAVAFLSDGYEDIYSGTTRRAAKDTSDQGAISMTPDTASYGSSSKMDTPDPYGSTAGGQQGYGGPDYGGSGYGGSGYDSQDSGYGRDYGSAAYGSYDDEYPGPSAGTGCSGGGVVKIFLERKN